MEPQNLRFGGALEGAVLHPIVLFAMLLGIVLIFSLKRKYVVIPLLALFILVPRGQGINLGGAHVFVNRIIILVGWLRLLLRDRPSRSELCANGFDSIDKVFICWASFHAIAFVLLYREVGAAVNQVATLWDTLGAFFLFRYLIRSEEDVEITIKALAGVATVVAAAMLNEHYRSLNVFGLLGGGTRIIPEVRDGAVRAQGPFAHPLTAGAFGATLLALFLYLWAAGKAKVIAAVGIISSAIISVLAASSTPILAFGASIVALCFWPLRGRMRMVRWALVIMLVSLHLVMKAPVWMLISHIDVTGGSSADHRAHLVDLFIRNVSDWWLVGTNNNANWGWDMWDTCNQYVQEGETGGMAAFICFIALLVLNFKKIGVALKSAKGNVKRQWRMWLLGAGVFANLTAFFGISYFDQTQFSWYVFLAIVAAAAVPVWAESPEKSRVVKELPVETFATEQPLPAVSGMAVPHWTKL